VKRKREKSVGTISHELSFKDPGNHTVAEQGKEQLKDYLPNLLDVARKGKASMPSKDFYIVVLTKRERLMQNVIRHYYFTRLSCPTPDYDQAVYSYNHNKDEIEFLWVVPDPITIRYFMENAFDIPPEDRCLLKYIAEFNDGTLDKLARRLNGEVVNQVNPVVKVA
jgi:exoribonuclease II